MANEENLVTNHERTPKERRENARKAGIASGKARRKKADLKKTLETILSLEVPDHKYKQQLENMGVDPNMEQGVALSVVLKAMTSGDHNALKTINALLGNDTSELDRKEQEARIERMQAETERIREETARKNGTAGHEGAQAQITAIADMINNPQAERVLSDYYAPTRDAEDAEDQGAIDEDQDE